MYKRILFPTDGSETSEKAVDHALSLASVYDASLYILHVVNIAKYSSLSGEIEWGSVSESLREEGEEVTENVKNKAEKKGIDVTTFINDGVPHKEILKISRDKDIDLIVMGTHGRSGVDRILLGSVTERVLRSSEIPMLVIGKSKK